VCEGEGGLKKAAWSRFHSVELRFTNPLLGERSPFFGGLRKGFGGLGMFNVVGEDGAEIVGVGAG
jgi:hypothetical protein